MFEYLLNHLWLIVLLVVGIIAILIAMRFLHLWLVPTYFGYPAVTQCRVCDKRVYVWQRKVEKSFAMPIVVQSQYTELKVYSSGTARLIATVHKCCEHGTPNIEPLRKTLVIE
jgi:hypothetical protein